EDIIHEIETQIEPLKKHQDTAKRYLSLKEELKQKEISLLIAEIEEIHVKWETLKWEMEQKEQEALHLHTEINKKEAWLEEQKQYNQKLDEAIEDLQEQRIDSTKQLENLEGKKELFMERTK